MAGREACAGEFVTDIFFQALQLGHVAQGEDVLFFLIHEEDVRIGYQGIGRPLDDFFFERWLAPLLPVRENIAYVPRIGRQGQKGPGLPVDMGNDATCGIQDDAIGHVGQDGGQERKLAAVFFIKGNEFQGVLVYGQDGRFAGPDGINRHGAVPGNLGQQSAADDGRIGRHRQALHHFQQLVIRRLDPVGRMDDEALAYIRRAGVDVEDEVFVQEKVDFPAGDVPQGVQDVVGRAVQAEDGDLVDGVG